MRLTYNRSDVLRNWLTQFDMFFVELSDRTRVYTLAKQLKLQISVSLKHKDCKCGDEVFPLVTVEQR